MPVFVYDDSCDFCSWFAWRVYRQTDWGVVGFSNLTEDETARLPNEYESQTHVLYDTYALSGGEAVEAVLNEMGVLPDDVVNPLSSLVVYRNARREVYNTVASRRGTFGRLLSADAPPTRR